MSDILSGWVKDGLTLREGKGAVLPNVWLGVSVEDQATADERIPSLLDTPAAVRFLSVEPMLGPILFRDVPGFNRSGSAGHEILNHLWVIVGGESGPGARPMHPDWARSIRDQCVTARVPFFFKQWGEWLPIDQPWKQDSPKNLGKNERWMNLAGGHGFHGENVWRMRRVGKKAAGRELDGRTWDEMPEGKT
jgi:protein gp37